MRKQNPRSPHGFRNYHYFQSMDRLYSYVSAIDEHTEGVPVPDESCKPGDKDFESYVADFVAKEKSHFAFVTQPPYSE